MPIITRKRFYSLFFGLVFLLALVVGLVYWQFRDLQNLRVMVQDQLEILTDRKVNIGAIEIDLTEGIGLKLHKLILTDPAKPEEKFSADEAGVTMGLWSLIRQEAQIQKVSFNGARLMITRKSRREWGVEGLGSFRTDQLGDDGRISEDWKKVKRLDLKNATITLYDPWMTEDVPIRLVAENVNVSLSKTILQTALLFSLEGRLKGLKTSRRRFVSMGVGRSPAESRTSRSCGETFNSWRATSPCSPITWTRCFPISLLNSRFLPKPNSSWVPGRQVVYHGKIFFPDPRAAQGEPV